MFKESLIKIWERDLNKLKDEIAAYESDDKLWTLRGEIKNSGGNLALHLVGNLNHFIGATLGETGYVRQRDNEFADKGISRDDIIASIEKTIEVVGSSLDKLSDDDFNKDFPVPKHEEVRKTDFMLLHLFGHFSYHIGQINYHRRLTS
jgi:uncharacterized damage-inducible protein DinB